MISTTRFSAIAGITLGPTTRREHLRRGCHMRHAGDDKMHPENQRIEEWGTQFNFFSPITHNAFLEVMMHDY